MPKILMDMPEPPAGWEYTGETQVPLGDLHLHTGTTGTCRLDCVGWFPALRRIKPATVMVELPREYVEWVATSPDDTWFTEHGKTLAAASKAALAKEDA